LTNDRELADLCRVLRNHGWSRDLGTDSPVYQGGADDFYEAYNFILPGYNVRPLELSGAVGIEQLKKLDGFLETRRKNAEHFVDLFGGDERFTIQQENGSSSWFSFTVILNDSVEGSRRRILDGLRDAGIEHRIITGGCFTRHEVIKYFDYETVGELPNANAAHDRGFFVGNFPRDARDEINQFHSVITKLAN
jgi:CDP-6-deoxy-D-xylo-4-hexulose-3-dehydrase